MVGQPASMEATFTATGEYGTTEALESLAASLWGQWSEAWRAWKTGDTSEAAPFHAGHRKPDEWRPTEQGVLAKKDIEQDRSSMVLDFVLKQNFFLNRQIVRGHGRLLEMEKVDESTAAPSSNHGSSQRQDLPDTINVGNWQQGGEALAQAFGPMLAQLF